MWFKMSRELLSNPAIWMCGRAKRPHDALGAIRVMTAIRVLCDSADGLFVADAAHLGRMYGIGARNAQIVWDDLCSSGVLRDTGSGWSARDWMAEHGLFGEPRTPSRARARKVAEPPAEPERPRKKEGWQAWFDDNGRFIGHD